MSDNLFWEDDYDSVYVIEDLCEEAPAFLDWIALDAPITPMLDYDISFSDSFAIDRLCSELAAHRQLSYAAIGLGDD